MVDPLVIKDGILIYCVRNAQGHIEIPNSVTEIGDHAFYGCTGLTNIEIPNSVTEIGRLAFSGCTGLTSIEIPNSVTEIGEEAFSDCTGLTSIKIPNSVTEIGRDAFYDCTGLTSILVDERNHHYCLDDGILYSKDKTLLHISSTSKTGEVIIPNNVTKIGLGAFDGCKALTSINIPNSVTEIGRLAFSDCTGLTSIKIPNSVTEIEEGAFSGCTGLTSILVDERNHHYCFEDGILYSKDKTLLHTCLTSKTGELTIPNSVTEIGWVPSKVAQVSRVL